MRSGPDVGGGRWVSVEPERLAGWVDRFAERHGGVTITVGSDEVELAADDGAVATCDVPFPPLVHDLNLPYGGLREHALVDRCVGVVLVRRGGYAVGVFQGTRLVASKVGSRLVQGRSAAGGTSQQRFARRREGQAREAFAAAADITARVLLPHLTRLDAVVLGGDRAAVRSVLDDRRLAPLQPLLLPDVLDVPEPRLRVLETTPALFRAVTVRVRHEPAAVTPDEQAGPQPFHR